MWGDDLWKGSKKQIFIISAIMRSIKIIMEINDSLLARIMDEEHKEEDKEVIIQKVYKKV